MRGTYASRAAKDAISAPPPVVEKKSRFPLSPADYAAELERRRPIAKEVTAALAAMYSSRRTPQYHSYAVRKPWGPWGPAKEHFGPWAIAASFLGQPTSGPDEYGCGRYCLNYDDDTTDWFAFDVDAHKDGETAEMPAYWIQRALADMGIDCLLARSSGGRGYHLVVKLSREIPGFAAMNLAAWVKRRAGVSPKTEVFPKGPRLGPPDPVGNSDSKPCGTQIAVPGCLNFYAKSGGGAVLYPDFEEVPLERLAERVRGVRRFDVDRLVAIEDALRRDPARAASEKWREIFREREERPAGTVSYSSAPGTLKFSSAHELAAWAESHGHPGTVKGSSKVVLHACPGNEHGSKRVDGAALLLRYDGSAWFKCHHAACEHFAIEHLVAKWGGALAAAPPVPTVEPAPAATSAPITAPRPPDIEYALVAVQGVDADAKVEPARVRARSFKPTAGARKFIFQVAREELAPAEIVRWGNVAVCYPFRKTKEGEKAKGKRVELYCDDHGKFNELPLCCSNNNACPGCARCQGLAEANFVVQHPQYAGEWKNDQLLGTGIALIVFDAGPDGTPTEKRDRVRAVSARYRKKKRRKDGIQRAYLAMTPQQLPALVKRLEEDGVTGWTPMSYDPRVNQTEKVLLDIGQIIYEVHVEPADLLLQYAEARDRANLLDLMKAMRSKIHRTSGPRHDLPWYSEARVQADAKAARVKAGLPEKYDGTICTRLKADGTACCKRGEHVAMDDDRVLSRSVYGHMAVRKAQALLRNELQYGKDNVVHVQPVRQRGSFVSPILVFD